MKKSSLKQIEEFIATEPLALVGVSRNKRKFGYTAFKELKEKGMKLIPVNPFASEINGSKVYNKINSLPDEIKGIIIMTKKEETAQLVREAKQKGLRQVWIQQMADSKEAIEELEGSGINYITKECIFMHYKPNGIHKFHRAVWKFFGIFPK